MGYERSDARLHLDATVEGRLYSNNKRYSWVKLRFQSIHAENWLEQIQEPIHFDELQYYAYLRVISRRLFGKHTKIELYLGAKADKKLIKTHELFLPRNEHEIIRSFTYSKKGKERFATPEDLEAFKGFLYRGTFDDHGGISFNVNSAFSAFRRLFRLDRSPK